MNESDKSTIISNIDIQVLCLIAVPVTIIIPNQQNARFVFISVAIILSCYLTVGLLFIPKVCSNARTVSRCGGEKESPKESG